VNAATAIKVLESIVSEFDRKEELERALGVFKKRIVAAEEKETSLFMEAVEFVKFEDRNDQVILGYQDLIDEIEFRKQS
jgi:hypothetical protein